jgi:hypothetical protein
MLELVSVTKMAATEATAWRGYPWEVPPRNELPRSVPVRAVLVSTGDLAVWLDGVRVFTCGFEFTLSFRRREAADAPWYPRFLYFTTDDQPYLATVEAVLADGRTGGLRGQGQTSIDGSPPAGPVISSIRSFGDPRHAEERLFLWPLPPPGPVTLRLSWPAGGIAAAEAQVDGEMLQAAAAEITPLWPEPPPNTGTASP